MAAGIHTELTFEEAIESHLIQYGGYEKGDKHNYNKELALDETVLFSFLQSTQPKEWEKLSKIHGSEIEKKLLYRLCKELELRGTLDVLRNGITDLGVKFRLAYFQPESGLNPDAEKMYAMNQLTVTRQVKYSKQNENSLDLVLSVNGLPVATAELKNQFTQQNVEHAKKQYMYDRDPKELLFQGKKRALVHFAVDTDEVYMTTKLDGKETRFLPFNKGNKHAAGNPTNKQNGYKTAYLWEQIWSKDSWMDILGKFVHLQVEDYESAGKKYKKETIIFPRYHQLEVVRKVAQNARDNGAGRNYLIQHSAGSGKSNSIAWLAYRLSSLHNVMDERVFDSVIVITDRKVLDQQLQNTIFQFDHKQGVVQKIDKDSAQLADALNAGSNIIITTLQKFPFILEQVSELPARKYAVIQDEAHSSAHGESSKKIKEILAAKSLEEAERFEADQDGENDVEDEIRKSMTARGQQSNLSFFAFTATPKEKTLKVFGEVGADGKPRPFHLYSMRQAIQEGFIHDVLKNYTTYKTFFQLTKAIEEDPALNKKKANKAIGKFVSLHPHNLAQKTEIMVEHFRQVTSKKIGGKAKAMVVTGSRLHAVRYYMEFQRYIKEKGYSEIRALVAFSGKVLDGGNEYTEVGLNSIKEKELPEKFGTDDYQVLLVADKYQTGFDQPLLHTMYVDKKLSGVKAVQTLSRLNRTAKGKEDTFVLDFANEQEDILNSFQPYYELTTVEQPTDPNLLSDLMYKIHSAQIIWKSEIDMFCEAYFKSKDRVNSLLQKKLNAAIDPAVDRFKGLPTEEEKEDFKHTLISFIRLYSFLSQIMPFQDMDMEKLFAYGRLLYNKLPKAGAGSGIRLDDEVALEYYRIQKIGEGSIALEDQGEYGLKGTTEAGMRGTKEEEAQLSEIIKLLNDRFGTDFSEADKLFFDQIEAELMLDEELTVQARSNSMENFKYGFNDRFLNTVIQRMELNQDIFSKIMDNEDFASLVKAWMLKKVYKKLNE
ncbi:type I restriction endonuclease subunit R [Rufibacter latericius]|uniref:Type I restriction endonuclease subunit R n=1 Tax=Rufibacter latericius TaxID=2487040 RepID=A0A3M9MAU0_9BACT|nr:DEAD/DEAH box helicase family protein [Rufibacter latericius]RNI22654.1 type I restriction endonuclease subunit R [Rufibacter latericius]